VTRPALSVAEISGSDQLRASLVPDVPGHYQARLSVLDAGGSVLQSIDVNLGTNGVAPEAAIAVSGIVGTGQRLLFDGSVSTDVDGDRLSYAWQVTDAPSGSSLAGLTGTGIRFGITPDHHGVYGVALIVSDATGLQSGAAEIVFDTSSGIAPVAASGWTSRVAKAGEALVLDAFASTDLDGD
ncbi:PKD domain-containing protein, partial [Halovulum sp. GXIMD14793]